MNGNIEQLNATFSVNARALAYTQNNPGVSVSEAVSIITRQDAAQAKRVTRIRETEAATKAQACGRGCK